jgi:hypothetical protein
VAPSLTIPATTGILVGAYGLAHGAGITAPSGFNAHGAASSSGGGSATNQISSLLADLTLVDSGASGTSTASAGTAAENVGQSLFLEFRRIVP